MTTQPMTQHDMDTLIATLNAAAAYGAANRHDDPALEAAGQAALARVAAGTKLREVPRQAVVYLLADHYMVEIPWRDGQYHAAQYSETVH